MIRSFSLASAAAVTVLFAFASPAAGQFNAETYDLRDGSRITDECVFCDRAPIVKPLAGSFVLTQLPSLVCCVWEVSQVAFQSPDGSFDISGEGNYGTSSIGKVTQQISLHLKVNDTENVDLASGPVEIAAPFPIIEITATEDGTRDPAHKYSIQIVAAPRRERVDYELVEGEGGSTFVDDCVVCERPTYQVPIAGTFRLSKVSDDANPSSLYAIDFVDFHGTGNFEGKYLIGGAGSYEYGGEVAITQQMSLNLTVDGDPDNLLESGRGPLPDGVVFPDITIDLVQQNPKSNLHVYSLHLVAKPAKSNLKQFRRGDPNADSSADISDAVFVLNWLFSGGDTPSCLESADTNTDGKTDLTDAVFLLNFLFQGGPEPSKPGTQTCGFPEGALVGCDSYAACGG